MLRVFDLENRNGRLEEPLPGMSANFEHQGNFASRGLRFDPGNFRLVKSFWTKPDKFNLSIVPSAPAYF